LYILSGKAFGISSSLQHVGAICAPRANLSYLRQYSWRTHGWNLIMVIGIIIGSAIATSWLSAEPVEFLPDSYHSAGGIVRLALGGVLVGFGTRYAGGCTSGHSITGLANLNWPSLVASISFFIGGIFVTWVLGSLIF
jgi:uncharacterized membrane protein YedE/YeeE